MKVGAVPNRTLGSVRTVPLSPPPGRRARLSSPGTARSSSEAREELRRRLLGLIEGNRVMIFSKSYCPHSTRVGGAGERQVGSGSRPDWSGAVGACGSPGAPLVLPAASSDLSGWSAAHSASRTHSRVPERAFGKPGLGTRDLFLRVVTRNQGRVPLLSTFGTVGEAATGRVARSNHPVYAPPIVFWNRGLRD